MIRARNGQAANVGHRVWVHLVAARYGTTPMAVENWPADVFAEAQQVIEGLG